LVLSWLLSSLGRLGLDAQRLARAHGNNVEAVSVYDRRRPDLHDERARDDMLASSTQARCAYDRGRSA
jgi:hypothetical protein